MFIQGPAYVEQIPAGAHPPPSHVIQRPLSPAEAKQLSTTSTSVAGLYVQFASVANQSEGLEAALSLSAHLKTGRPPIIRGVSVTVNDVPRLHMLAGPFQDNTQAAVFCAAVLPKGEPCLVSRRDHF